MSIDDISIQKSRLSQAKRMLLERRMRGGFSVAGSAHKITPRKKRDSTPLSFAQQRLWVFDQLDPGNTTYNFPKSVRLTGSLNFEALTKTLDEIVNRHEILRTTYQTINGESVQIVNSPCPLNMPVIDLHLYPDNEREHAAEQLIDEESRRSFDLSKGPLLRTSLIRLGDDDHILLLMMHHIVCDGWSLGVLVREVAALYEAYSAGKPSPLSELPIQYADYAQWQREWLSRDLLHKQMSYWKQQLADAPSALELPTDYPRPAVQTTAGARQAMSLSKEMTESVKELSQREGMTVFMVLLGAFNILLHRYTGQQDIVVGTDVANRNHADTEGLLGFFVNQLVLRIRLAADLTFREALKQVRKVALDAYAHQDVPFDQLVKTLNPPRDASRSPIFQVKLILQSAPMPPLKLPGLMLAPMEAEKNTADQDLTLALWETEQGLRGALEYNTNLFSPPTIRRMLEQFERILKIVTSEPEAKLEAILDKLKDCDKQQQVAQEKELEAARLLKFKTIKRKAVSEP